MNFTHTDMMIIISMTIAVVVMTFVFPAADLANADEAESSDIPEFDIDSSRFDFAGDFPSTPDPSSGTLTFDNNRSDEFADDREDYHHGDRADGVRSRLVGVSANSVVSVSLQEMLNGGINQSEQVNLENVGETKEIHNDSMGYTVQYTLESRENNGTSDVVFDVDYKIVERPEDTSFIGSIPVIGSAFSAAETLANVLGWIGSVLFWLFGTLFEVTFNLVGVLFDVMVFGIDTASWLVTTWQAIAAGSASWAQVFVAIPGLLLFLEFGKLVMIGISLLPTT